MLLDKWTMIYDEYDRLFCTAPCSMYGVLLEHGLIEDPFYGLNEQSLTALSDKDCAFECEFHADAEITEKEHVMLVFYGLDTICRIVLNGTVLSDVKNMHRRYVFDVKDRIVCGKNLLRLEFSSPTKYFKEMNNKHYLEMNHESLKGASHLRKALYMSGWDWGPTLPDMGIFRPVELDAYDGDRIEWINIRQKHTDKSVALDISIETRHGAGYDCYVNIDGKEMLLDRDGHGEMVIENPRLWWVRGYGEQYLYDVMVRLEKDGAVIHKKTQKLGLRTLTVSTAQDDDGSEFCFVLNGVKIFAMGANYIPIDNLTARITPDRIEKIIHAAVDANFNCLRVWGGGYYPEDEFYDLCDKYGIMVWQDSMVACANIRLNSAMREEFTEELIYNLKRLRYHASLGLWCGNNEMEDALASGWEGYVGSQLVMEDYLELYERLMPELVEKYAPDTYYWRSSPSSGGGFDEPSAPNRGDVHFWAVWHGGVPFTEYRKHRFRFCSEYGFQSYPCMKTINSFSDKADQNCFSRVMEGHQKCVGKDKPSGNLKILMYLADNYLYPVNFETLVYASQLLQSDAIKYGVEYFRRNRGYTMGSVYWQINDCWPVASWSSVDSFGRYKALHFAARKFYAPVAMALFNENGGLSVNIANETMARFCGSVRLFVSDAHFNVKREITVDVTVDALTSADVMTEKLILDDPYNEFICADLYDADGNFIMRQTELLVPPKHFEWEKPDICVKMTDTSDGVEVRVSSDVFAKGIYLDFDDCDPVLSDNFFDLTSREEYVIIARTERSADELKELIKVMSVYDIGR
ncbi:MAG: glycoside hydrolase family 2 protein [Ruminococcaceae bacterium]|nr:glycoside hydrolase family 2 protein [Oscillospiraceae bacterium]